MNLSGESGTDYVDAIPDDPRRVPASGSWVTFTPLVFDGLTWSRITASQQGPRAACLLVTVHIHLHPPVRKADLRQRLHGAREPPPRLSAEHQRPAVAVGGVADEHAIGSGHLYAGSTTV